MNKKTQKKYVALLTMLAMVICTMFCTNTVKADTELPFSNEDVIKTCASTYNNIERTLWVLKNGDLYLKYDNKSLVNITSYALDSGFDKNGALWFQIRSKAICWFNPDLQDLDSISYNGIPQTNPNYEGYTEDATNLVYDSQDYVTGYKLSSGEIKPTLSLEIMKIRLGIYDEDDDPTPTPTNSVSTPTPTPTAPVSTPPATPKVTPTTPPKNTTDPVVTPKTVTTKKVVKKKAGYSCLSIGNKVTSKYKLAKGKLTWKGSSKSKKYSGIKSAAFIKKSGNLVFLTKKGKVYTLSPKGKKKCIVKKKGKKLILKNKFAVKVQVGKKFINLANQ